MGSLRSNRIDTFDTFVAKLLPTRRNSAISESLRVLKNAIISSLPDADKNELSDPFFGLVSTSCQQLLDHLRERYGTFLASDFDAFRSDLNAKIGIRTFTELAAQHDARRLRFLLHLVSRVRTVVLIFRRERGR